MAPVCMRAPRRDSGCKHIRRKAKVGAFESENRAQIWLIPSNSQTDPNQFPPQSEVGDLAATFTDVPAVPSLWFCIVAGGPWSIAVEEDCLRENGCVQGIKKPAARRSP